MKCAARRGGGLALGAALALLGGAAAAAEHSFTIDRFDSVRLTDVESTEIVTGATAAVYVEGARSEIDRLKVSDEGGILDIAPRLHGGLSAGVARVRLRITVPMINHLALRGAGTVRVSRIAAPGFNATLAGPGRIAIADIEVISASFSTAGSGSITAAGRCRDVRAGATGSGDIDIARLHCTTLAADTAGSGDIRAYASGSARITITGAGNVQVSGGARCTVSAIGSGRAICK